MLDSKYMTYDQKVLSEHADDYPSYFSCGRRNLNDLIAKAESEAAVILNDFKQFFRGDIGINIVPHEYATCFSIGATLTVNGEICREYDTADLCFLELNELMLKRLIDAGLPAR